MTAISGSEDNTAVIVGASIGGFALLVLVLATCSLIWGCQCRKRAKMNIFVDTDQ